MAKKQNYQPATGNSAAVAAERKAAAVVTAVDFAANVLQDFTTVAIRNIEELLAQFSIALPFLLNLGFGQDHLIVSVNCCE